MVDVEGENFVEDDLFLSFQTDSFADLFGDANDLLLLQQPSDENPVLIEECSNNPSPDSSAASWGIRQVEEMLLMEEDEEEVDEGNLQECFQEIFSQILHEVSDDHPQQVKAPVLTDEASASGIDNKDEEDDDDQISKKLKRQIRNRDAALRSRERKKMYVRDLEMKSRYLEGECMRLQRLLQCCAAENHALHLQLQHKSKASVASPTKQESAVLLLESLLLGSLLWLVGIVCLLPLPGLLCPALEAAALLSVGEKDREIVDLILGRGAKNEKVGLGTLRLFFKCKQCKATRGRMKFVSFTYALLA